MLSRASAEWPPKQPLSFGDEHIVDACFSARHQAGRIELPLLVAVGTKPPALCIAAFVDEADGDPCFRECPDLFDQSILLLGTPLAGQEGLALVQFTAIHPTPEWRFFAGDQVARFAFDPAYVTNSADAAIAHAESGGGLTMVLAYQVMDALRAGKLRVVLPDFEPPPLPIHIVYPTTRLLSAKVRAFIDLVVATRDWQFVDL